MFFTQTIYLASASPRRHELLHQIGIHHEVLLVPAPKGEDEPIYTNESAISYVKRTAHEKLQQALSWRASQTGLAQDWPILCADTTVELEGEILGKPKDLAQANQVLQKLSNKTHQVHTAACLGYNGAIYTALSSSQIRFKSLSDREIAHYCLSREPLGKAGSYGIQGVAAAFIARLEGSYSGVMGLDLFQTHDLFNQAGLK